MRKKGAVSPGSCLYSSRNESRYRLSMTAYSFFACKWTQRLYSLIESSSAASAEDKFRVRRGRGVHGAGNGNRSVRGARQTGRKHNVRKETSGAVPLSSPLRPPSSAYIRDVSNPFCLSHTPRRQARIKLFKSSCAISILLSRTKYVIDIPIKKK